MDHDLRRGALAVEVSGQCRNGLQYRQSGRRRIVPEDRDRRVQLVQDIHYPPVRMKRQVAWPRTGAHLRKWPYGRLETSNRRIEIVDQHPVLGQVTTQDACSRRIEPARVWERGVLV